MLLGVHGLPAWARTFASSAAGGVRRPDSLPFPHLPAGTPSMPEIKHIVVLIMENHSFDNLLGMVPHRVPGRAGVDGLTLKHGRPVNFNPDVARPPRPGPTRQLAVPAAEGAHAELERQPPVL